MAVAAEAIETFEIHHQQEEYARSMASIRRWGGAVAVGSEATLEQIPAFEQLTFDDCVSALREMLKTDADFRDKLDINDKREHDIVDGTVRAADGTPMVTIIADGKKSSEAAAFINPELQAQVIRDGGDVYIAERVDKLQPGSSLLALSRNPAKQLADHKKTYRGLGYREDLDYLQWYAKTAGGETVVAGSYSVDMSDEATWRGLFADLGVDVPADESEDTWIYNCIERELTPEQTEQFVRDIREEYYKRREVSGERYSISEYIEDNAEIVKSLFDAYYPALAEAVYSGQNNATLQGFAQALLQTDLSNMKPEVRRQLLQVGNTQHFDDELGRTMDSVIRYAIVEELREGLGDLVDGHRESPNEQPDTATITVEKPLNIIGVPPEVLNQRMANRVQTGVEAGRSYGGCSNVDLNNEADGSNDSNNPQEAYGGKSNRESKGSPSGKINCIKCRASVNEQEVKRDPKSWRCPHCKYEVDICTKEVKHQSEPPEKGAKQRAERSVELAPVISLKEKREEKQAIAISKLHLGDVVQLQTQSSNQPTNV